MKLTIDINVLKRNNISLGQFLILLLAYYNFDYDALVQELIRDGTANANVFKGGIVLSDKVKNLITAILVESNDRVSRCKINFPELADALMELYPKGNKPGTTYSWRGTEEEIIQKLRTLVSNDFMFTEEEAKKAVKEYVDSFEDTKHMQLLKYFLLKTTNKNGISETNSQFMTIIENNREATQEGDIGDLEDALG